MAQGSHIFLLTTIAIVFLLVISKCYSYPSFRELPGKNLSIWNHLNSLLLLFRLVLVGGRPMKSYSSNGGDPYLNRVRSVDKSLSFNTSSYFYLDETILWNHGTTSTLASRYFWIQWNEQRWITRYILKEFNSIIWCLFFSHDRFVSTRRLITIQTLERMEIHFGVVKFSLHMLFSFFFQFSYISSSYCAYFHEQ